MWTRQNNGYDLNWAQAQDFCSHLDLGGYRDWRLPTINELAAIYDERQNEPHIKGGIRIEERWIWSSAVGTSSLTGSSPFFTAPYQQGKSDQKALSFGFLNGARYASWVDESYMQRALCVRRAD
jgi:hypothetical protein